MPLPDQSAPPVDALELRSVTAGGTRHGVAESAGDSPMPTVRRAQPVNERFKGVTAPRRGLHPTAPSDRSARSFTHRSQMPRTRRPAALSPNTAPDRRASNMCETGIGDSVQKVLSWRQLLAEHRRLLD